MRNFIRQTTPLGSTGSGGFFIIVFSVSPTDELLSLYWSSSHTSKSILQ